MKNKINNWINSIFLVIITTMIAFLLKTPMTNQNKVAGNTGQIKVVQKDVDNIKAYTIPSINKRLDRIEGRYNDLSKKIDTKFDDVNKQLYQLIQLVKENKNGK